MMMMMMLTTNALKSVGSDLYSFSVNGGGGVVTSNIEKALIKFSLAKSDCCC